MKKYLLPLLLVLSICTKGALAQGYSMGVGGGADNSLVGFNGAGALANILIGSGLNLSDSVLSATGSGSSGNIVSIRIVTTSGPVTVSTTDCVVIVKKTSSAPTIVNIPALAVAGQIFIIKDGKGDAQTNNITITPSSGTIDGQATCIISTNFAAKQLIYDGINWEIL